MTEEDTGRHAELGVVLVTDSATTIATVLSCLRAQTVRGLLEIVIVGPSSGELDSQALGEGFASVSVVEVPALESLEQARALGVRRARAPIVFLGETHSYPEPGFAEALISAHAGPWAAVAPAIENANPESSISAANLVLDYGRWLAPGPAREVETVPDFNCSFKREALLGSARPLEELFEERGSVSQDLRGRGHRLFLEPAARLGHLNVAAPRKAWLRERYLAGRLLGGARSAVWPGRRRLLYLAGLVAVPILHVSRGLRVARRLHLPRARYVTFVPSLLVGSLAWTVGEGVGYVCGSGTAPQSMVKYELHKKRYVPDRDS